MTLITVCFQPKFKNRWSSLWGWLINLNFKRCPKDTTISGKTLTPSYWVTYLLFANVKFGDVEGFKIRDMAPSNAEQSVKPGLTSCYGATWL